MKVKICGLSRIQDIWAVNKAKPNYCGFILNVEKSPRNINTKTLSLLRKELSEEIIPVGVFVNEPVENVAKLLNSNTILIAQLHGDENEEYISTLRQLTNKSIWQAFQISDIKDIEKACKSSADFLLLDAGSGGGKVFDWSVLSYVNRSFALAGGLNEKNLDLALKTKASLLDLSSGVETLGEKDPEKIYKIVNKISEYKGE